MNLDFTTIIERRDSPKNLARFYAISIEATLLGGWAVVRRWGRIGTAGRTLVHLFEDPRDAVSMYLILLARKRRRGYVTRESPPPA
ncbi:WGR domain-containing protein [Mycoplana dimorpha]